MDDVVSFCGQIRFPGEHTIYRVYVVNGGFAFIRTGRNEMHQVRGSARLLQIAVTSSVNRILQNGPARMSAGELAAMDGKPLEELLNAHRRNFFAGVKDISDVQITLPLIPALGWKKPGYVFWKMRVKDRGKMTVWVGGEGMKVAIPLIVGLFGDVLSGRWGWDSESWDFRKRR
jgi:hypothetical protein